MGDLLLARSRPIAGFGNTGHAASEQLDELRTEALARLRASRYWIMKEGRWQIAYEAAIQGYTLALPESFPGRHR